jgi:hypothetical protein
VQEATGSYRPALAGSALLPLLVAAAALVVRTPAGVGEAITTRR